MVFYFSRALCGAKLRYDIVNYRLFVTGKLWPHLFEINLVEQQ